MRNVLFLDQSGARAGGQTVLANLVEQLASRGTDLQCTVAVPEGPIHDRFSGVPGLLVRRPASARDWLAAARPAGRPFDWLVANSPKVLGLALQAAVAARLGGAPTRLAFVVHANPSTQAKARVVRALAQGVDAVLPVAASQWTPGPPYPLPPLGLRSADLLSSAEVAAGLARRRRVIKAMARRDRVKGLDVLLQALPAPSVPPGWSVELASAPGLDGDRAFEQRLIHSAAAVHVNGPRNARWIAPGDIVVVPSRSETACLLAQEAMGRGALVVASAVGDIPRYVTDGRNGLLVPPGDPAALAAALRRATALPNRQVAAMCQAGHATAAARADRWYDAVTDLLTGVAVPCAA